MGSFWRGTGQMTYQGDGIMRRLTVLTAALVSSSMLAGAAAATDTDSFSGVCQAVEDRLDLCASGARLSVETRASCDRVEQGSRALCGPLETIVASASADSAALDLLREDYEVVPIEDAETSVFPSHVVIGPFDLDDPDVIAALREAHRADKTVAIANATKDEARSFHRLLRAGQEANCAPLERASEIEIYGLQQSEARTPPQNSSFCLLSLDDRAAVRDRRWLRDRFASAPPQPPEGEVALTDSTAFLSDLADATHCSFKFTDNTLGSVEWDLYTYAMRNFTDTGCGSCADPGADYYLVQDAVTFTPAETSVTYNVSIRRPSEASSGSALTEVVGLEFSDPQTVTSFKSSYSNSSSVTISGSVGLSAKGPDVTAGGSVTAGKSTTYSVPPTTILQQSDTTTAEPDWEFKPQSTTVGVNFDPNTTWVWFVPRDAYPSGGTGSGQIAFSSGANIFHSGGNTDVFKTCNVPYPFSAWTVAPPQLASLGPTSVSKAGGQFTVTGQFLYPSSVTAVLIGGTPVPLTTNVDLKDDTEVIVTVGGASFDTGTNKVQVNTQFNGQNRFSNTLDLDLTD
jgi:hypothetical protein